MIATKVPELEYQAPDLGWVLSRHAFGFLLLFAWTAAAIAFAWQSIGKLRVD